MARIDNQHLSVGATSTTESADGVPSGEQAPKVSAALQKSQIDIEDERSKLARTLHDDLGGLLVGAIMDIGWLASQSDLPKSYREKLERAQGLLKSAIDLKRELIENIRPTLLDNVGLFSTLRWHLKERCEAAEISCTAKLPAAEQTLSPEVRIGVFRIFQEALSHVVSNYGAGDVLLKVDMIGDTLHCRLDYKSSRPEIEQSNQTASPHTSMHHRANQVGGILHWASDDAGCQLKLEVLTGQLAAS